MRWINSIRQNSSGWYEWSPFDGLTLDVFCCRRAKDGPMALVTAGVHGDEYEGPVAIAKLAAGFAAADVRGTIVLIPVVNPSAFRAATRLTPEDGLNLARTFPGTPNGTLTERLAHAVFDEFAMHADYLIDLHSGGRPYDFLPLAGFYGELNPENASLAAAKAFGLPMLWQLPPTGGVLSYEASRRGKVSIGNEYCGGGRLSQKGVEDYSNGVLRCLRLWGFLCRDDSSEEHSADVFEGDWILASYAGVFRSRLQLGALVRIGEPIAEIRNTRGELLESIVAAHDGMILGLRVLAYIGAGEWAVLVGRQREETIA